MRNIGMLEMQILWLLAHRPAHGYELMKKLNEIKTTKVEQGTLYPVISKLKKERMIAVMTKGKRRKKVYKLTPYGRSVMKNSCNEFIKTFFGIINDYMCKKCR